MQKKTITIHLKSAAELRHYAMMFENTIYMPFTGVVNTQDEKFILTLKLNKENTYVKSINEF